MTKMAMLTAAMALAAAMTGCDALERRTVEAERADGTYRAAMADYAAGRMDQAIAGLEKVVRSNPANGSARFQLGCLLQDVRKDYLGAICNYRDYLLLSPDSDKSQLARDRIDTCERLLAPVLARKLKITDVAQVEEARQRLAEEKASVEKTLAATKADQVRLQNRYQELEQENRRLRRLLGGFEKETAVAAEPKALSDRDLLDDDEPTAATPAVSEVDKLLAEEKEETAKPYGAPPPPKAKKAKDPGPRDEPVIERPKEYVVKENDTLYSIARRYYGRTSAWKLIREANKTVISTDGRVRTGQKLVLP